MILSGTGSDGSRGIRDIHAAGGLVLVQSEETAKFNGMPRSAIETGVADAILSPLEMAQTLAKYAKHPVPKDVSNWNEALPIDESSMDKLMRLLRDACGIDFSLYKQTTVGRRIERRLLLNHSNDLDKYVQQVASDPAELNSLYRDLLIGVTQFFRDADAFSALEKLAIPQLIQNLDPQEDLRVWVAGCATGEEAYSIAILVHEQLSKLGRPLSAKIFATDVHRASLDFASAGCYDESRLVNVSPERLDRYFIRKGEQYQVVPELRQMIVFAPHNLLRDAAFTRLDLISCRNLLIYFEPATQKRLLALFHFGLKHNGLLLLGPSEGLSGLEQEFAVVDSHWKIFRKVRDIRLPAEIRLATSPTGQLSRLPIHRELSTRVSKDADLVRVYDQILDRMMPPGVLLNNRRELVHVFGDAARFLHFRTGRTTSDAADLFDRELKTAVTGAIQRAIKQGATVACSAVDAQSNGSPTKLRLEVQPLFDQRAEISYFLVTLQELDTRSHVAESIESLDAKSASTEQIGSLQEELRVTKENLQTTIEELETSNEELQATNEELVASNEELQSTNEELHSVNEELYTVNAEYQRKITELTELTDDMANLLQSTDIGVLFLDRDLCIRRFTPRITTVLNITDRDIGRPFDNFTHKIEQIDLLEDIRWVATTGQPFEKEVRDNAKNWYLLRIVPYKSSSDVTGLVITLIDIGSLKKTEDELHDRDRQLQGILDHSPAFMYVKDLEGRYLLVNRQSRRVLGAKPQDVIGKTNYDFFPRSVADRIEAHDRHVASTGKKLEVEEVIPKQGRGLTYLFIKYPLRDEAGRIFAVAGISTNITRHKLAQRKAGEALKQRDRFLATLSHELRNPLAAVRNGVEVLSLYRSDQPHVQTACEAVRSQTAQMTRIIDDLLDISRITQGKIELRKDIVDLNHVARNAIEAVRSIVSEHDHRLSIEIPDNPLYVEGDAARLQQIQTNLLVNAVKYTPDGGTITFSLSREGDTALLRVRDTGIGLSQELLSRAFEPFVQAEGGVGRSEGGMGIGLTLVRTFVDLHGGEVKVESAGKGKGTEFFVRLPLTTKKPHARHDPEPVPFTKDLRILLVEDNEYLRDTTQILLESEGYQVGVAADGLSALTAIEVERPDVALVDIGLPELDGYAVARRAREHHICDRTYLIALTGFGQETDRQRAFEAGFDEHITKPIELEQLTRVLQRAVGRRQETIK
jgi:two-component system CheB/CheR fusion protein